SSGCHPPVTQPPSNRAPEIAANLGGVMVRIIWGLLLAAIPVAASAASITSFSPGDLVISTVTGTGTTLDAASPLSLQELSLGAGGASAGLVGTFGLPQTANGANSPISGEWGSASEGFLQKSVNGMYLTLMGYGVNATTFNTAPSTTYGTAALGQTTS